VLVPLAEIFDQKNLPQNKEKKNEKKR